MSDQLGPPAPVNLPPSFDGQVKTYQPTARLTPAARTVAPPAAGSLLNPLAGIAAPPPPPADCGPPLARTVLPWVRPDVLCYVNGIQTPAASHRDTAELLANICERPVNGVYNPSYNTVVGNNLIGMIGDIHQCANDYMSVAASGVVERLAAVLSGVFNVGAAMGSRIRRLFDPNAPDPRAVSLLDELHRLIPAAVRARQVEARLASYNLATRGLYRHLVRHRNASVCVVAHSQGNLITCDALWALAYVYGEAALEHVRVLSLASPAPVWPLGMRWRRLEYGSVNDPVANLARPQNFLPAGPLQPNPLRSAGDWRRFEVPGNPLATATYDLSFFVHNINRHIWLLNVAKRLRAMHALPELLVPPGVR